MKTTPKGSYTEACDCCFDRIQQTVYQYTCNSKTCAPFTGKELDSETGYSYFGARYYDAELSGLFFSVDPMADKYPSETPYNYCIWNPIMIVDPNGSEVWKPELLIDGTVNYVIEKGDNANTLQRQYKLSYNDATLLYSTMKNGKISGESVKTVTGSEILKLDAKNSSGSRFLYHLGFSIMYNHEKQENRCMRLNDYFNSLPQDVGDDCKRGTPKYLSDIKRSILGQSNELYSIPVKGGGSIPVTYFDFLVPGNALITRDCYGIQERRPGYVNLKMNYTNGKICNGQTAIIIQVPIENKIVFEESYGN